MKITKNINTLKDYLHFNYITYREFAKKCGMNPSMIGNFCNGKTVPEYRTAKILSEATNGAISAEDLIRFCFEKKLQAWVESENQKDE
jgi:transcriptional regulator with XRE-family HTH domain